MHKELIRPPFTQKALLVANSLLAGISERDTPELSNLVNEEYRSPREHLNPDAEEMEGELLKLIGHVLDSGSSTSLYAVPWSRYVLSKGLFLQTMVAFSDQHNQAVPGVVFAPTLASAFTKRVVDYSDKLERQVTIPEQYAIALQITRDKLLGAALIAHSGSRAIARGMDNRVDSKLQYSIEEIGHWRDCVATFEETTGEYGDPPGDNYHFWGAFSAGILSETIIHKRDLLLNHFYRFIYLYTAEFTNLLRYKLARNPRKSLHEKVDRLGFKMGSGIALRLLQKPTPVVY